MTTLLSRAALVAAAMALGLSGAHAYMATSNLTVALQVNTSCSVDPASLNFGGVLSGQTGNVDVQTNLSISCPGRTSYKVQMGNGNNVDTDGTRRVKNSGGDYIRYGLFSDSSRSTAWASSGVSFSSSDTVTVYGRVSLDGTAPSGMYGDAVLITLIYN